MDNMRERERERERERVTFFRHDSRSSTFCTDEGIIPVLVKKSLQNTE